MNFEYYSLLLAIPVALVLAGALFLANSKSRQRLVRQFASDRLVQQLLTSYSPLRRKFKNGLILTSLALIIFALARPQWGYTWQETKTKGIDIMFVVDVSQSMLAQDIKPNRLERSKLAILDFIDKLQGDRVGLVAFAGNAFLQCPLTLDYDAFQQSLEAIDTNVISLGGTDIARAITEAEAAFSEENNYKILVMITDGEDLEEDGVQRAREAAEDGITIYTVGVGTPEGELIPVRNRFGQLGYLRDDNGELVRTQLDADTLNQIAEVTNGFYAALGPTGYGLEQVYEAGLASIPEQELASRMEKAWIERFQWPLALAILLLAWEPLIGTRRFALQRKAKPASSSKTSGLAAKAAALVLLATLFFGVGQLDASVRDGERHFRNGVYDQAAEAFKAAVEANPLNAQASFNLGNTYQALGQWEQAQSAYARALATTDLSLQADAFYNLGSLRFTEAQKKMAEIDPSAVSNQAQAADASIAQAIHQGRAVLDEAGQTDDLSALMPQVQQSLQLAEQAKAAGEESMKAAKASQAVTKPVSQAWEQAAKDFQSSLDLNPTGDDAAHNFNYVQQQLESLKRDINQIKRIQSAIESQQPELEEVIEALRELLEQQQQDQQQQDQQQNQDQQNQDQQQSSSDSQQQQNQQQQQSSDSSSEQQNQQQQQSEQQSGEQSEQEQQSGEEQQQAQQEGQESTEQEQAQGEQSEEGEQQAGEQNEDSSEEGENAEANQRDSEEVDEMIDAMQQGENEESGEESMSQNGQQEGEQKDQSGMRLSEEDAQQLQEQAAQAAAAQASKGEPTGEGVPIGVMTRDDAGRLLESLKRYEKKLPVSGYGRRDSNRDEEGKRKDW